MQMRHLLHIRIFIVSYHCNAEGWKRVSILAIFQIYLSVKSTHIFLNPITWHILQDNDRTVTTHTVANHIPRPLSSLSHMDFYWYFYIIIINEKRREKNKSLNILYVSVFYKIKFYIIKKRKFSTQKKRKKEIFVFLHTYTWWCRRWGRRFVVVVTAVILDAGAADISFPSTDGPETRSVWQISPSRSNILNNERKNYGDRRLRTYTTQ